MRRISPAKTGLAVGSVFGIWHLGWVILVGIGWAQPLLDFILRLHFLRIEYALLPYNVTTASTLLVVTFAVGAVIGLIFAIVWNWLSFESAPEWAFDGRAQATAE